MKKFYHGLLFLGFGLAACLFILLTINSAAIPAFVQAMGVEEVVFLPVVIRPDADTPTATPVPTESATQTPTTAVTLTPTITPSPSPTSSPTTAVTPTPSATATAVATATPIPTTSAPTGIIYADHTSIDLFDEIPEGYIQAAADIDMFYMDRSVGQNINEGLDCLSYSSNEVAPSSCTNNEHSNPDYRVDPAELEWSRPGGYDRSNWDFEFWQTPGCGQWFDKVDCFMSRAEQLMNQYDVLSYQFSYLAVGRGSSINNEPGGFFYDNSDRSDVYDLEAFEAEHPDKIFIYWTTSLARSIGTEESDVFNADMRQYAQDNDKILFDVADILAHDPDGNPCYDNQSDGVNHLAICPHYTTEINGGHLGSVSAGKIRVAKAFWVLMAQIAGWEPTP